MRHIASRGHFTAIFVAATGGPIHFSVPAPHPDRAIPESSTLAPSFMPVRSSPRSPQFLFAKRSATGSNWRRPAKKIGPPFGHPVNLRLQTGLASSHVADRSFYLAFRIAHSRVHATGSVSRRRQVSLMVESFGDREQGLRLTAVPRQWRRASVPCPVPGDPLPTRGRPHLSRCCRSRRLPKCS